MDIKHNGQWKIAENKVHTFFLEPSICLDSFECNTTSDWLNQTVLPIRSCVTFKFTNSGDKDKECS